MIIRDLEHSNNINNIEEIRGAGANSLLIFDIVGVGTTDSAVGADVDIIATNAGGVSLSGISVTAQAVAV